MIKLDILSDPICPWCYIGKIRLEKALAEVKDHPFAIEWHPFQLNPDMPREGMDRRTYLEAKFGGKENAVKTYAEIDAHARQEGIEMDLAAIARTPNTLDAHRLIHWAGIEDKQGAVVDALFAAYFEQGRDIGDAEVLCDIADSAGLDGAVTARLLQTDEDVDLIRRRDAHSREMGVSSVPTFIVANQHAVPGAQPTDLWLKVIGELKEQQAAE
ncbi:DsbA family protein [Shimia sp. FJ5]|uniref:DsbA family oxidoreductase n=1 Tax=Shimia sp. FJ5 TaxID=3079054 RepID=UPI00262621E3|nr:DsbA family oxidoreductase [Shimia sp. FJ5]MDV4144157.1 DsbA family oxidoreductase [Shimia sp. FJ5]